MFLCRILSPGAPPFRQRLLHRNSIDFKRIEIIALGFAMGVARVHKGTIPSLRVGGARRIGCHLGLEVGNVLVHDLDLRLSA